MIGAFSLARPRALSALRWRAPVLALLAGTLLVGTAPGLALAAAPANDLPAGAIAFTALPASIAQDTTEATVSTDDVGCGAGGLDQATVWYTLTLASATSVLVDATASGYEVGVNIFEGTADANHIVTCASGAAGFDAAAGTTYYLMFADIDGGANGGQLSVAIDVAPPPIAVSITVNANGKVNPKTGEATVSGTITCSNTADFSDVEVSLRQSLGRFTIHGSGFDSPSCGPTPTAWFAAIVGDNGKFAPGRATADVSAFACDAFSCGDASASTSVRLGR